MTNLQYSPKDTIILDGVFSGSAYLLASNWLGALRQSFLAKVTDSFFVITLGRLSGGSNDVSIKIEIVVDPLLITLRMGLTFKDGKVIYDLPTYSNPILVMLHKISWDHDGSYHPAGGKIDFKVITVWEHWASSLAEFLFSNASRLRALEDITPSQVTKANRLLAYTGDGAFDRLDSRMVIPAEFSTAFKPYLVIELRGKVSVDAASLDLASGWLLALESAFFSDSVLSRRIMVTDCHPAVVNVVAVFPGDLLLSVVWREKRKSSVTLASKSYPQILIAEHSFDAVRDWEMAAARLLVENVSPVFAQPLEVAITNLNHLEVLARQFAYR